MATVDVTVGGKAYQLACEDGQERRLRALAATLDAEARALASQTGPVGEARLLLMVALTLADRLEDAEAALKAAPAPTPGADAAELAQLAAAVARIEALAAGPTP